MKALLIPIIFLSAFLPAGAQYRNLVFEGGGIRGVAFTGAVSVLEQYGVLKDVENVAGTSAGSIIGLMLSLGYSSEEIKQIMISMKVENFNDGKGGIIGKYARAKQNYAIYKGEALENWLGKVIEKKTGDAKTTFGQLHALRAQNIVYKEFSCVGTNLTKQKSVIFSFANTPNFELKKAVRISCAIPFFYAPVLLDSVGNVVEATEKGVNYDVMVDGGVMANYPLELFDKCHCNCEPLLCDSLTPNPQTLGFKLERNEQIEYLKAGSGKNAPYSIHSLGDYTHAFMNLVMERMNYKANNSHEKARTVYIGYNNVFSKPRRMKPEEKLMLYNNGINATVAFLKANGMY